MRLKDYSPLYLGVLVSLLVVMYISPIIYMVLISFKPAQEIFSTALVFNPTFKNYADLFRRLKMHLYFTNSTLVSLFSAFFSLVIGSVAAYSFSRYIFKGRKLLLFVVLFSRMMPPIGAVVPLYLVLSRWGLAGSLLSLILIYTAFNVPFVIWMMRGFFIGIPREMEESGMIDGCSRFGAFMRIVLPASAPGLAATAIFSFTLAWNEFLYALIFTGMDTKTIPVVVPELIGEMGVLWGQISGAGTLAILPIMIFSFLVQKNLVRGLTFGAVKG
jgi:multiple sugar transport system permease protein